jgi:Zn ribbon nucleic-acid-binding protein
VASDTALGWLRPAMRDVFLVAACPACGRLDSRVWYGPGAQPRDCAECGRRYAALPDPRLQAHHGPLLRRVRPAPPDRAPSYHQREVRR